jgi:hypothetical protein
LLARAAGLAMEEITPKKAVWLKVGLMLVVLVPFVSCLFYFVYFWIHGVSFTK